MLKKGETIKAVVLSVDQEKQRIALGLKQMQEDPWTTVIPANYRPGMVVKGHVTKIANFGVFVELEPGLEGLLHISEISDQKVEKPEDSAQGRPGTRRQDPPRRQRRAEDRPVAQARPVGPGRGTREEPPEQNEPKSAACAAAWKAANRRAGWAISISQTNKTRNQKPESNPNARMTK